MRENPIIGNFECPRCGPRVVRQSGSSFMQGQRSRMYGEEEDVLSTRPTAWLQQDADSEYKNSHAHLTICAEITKRVEGGEILLSIEYLRASRKRMSEQFAWQDRGRFPDGNPNLSNSQFEGNKIWWAKRDKEKCRGCYFLPPQCGCALAITAYEPHLAKCDYQAQMDGVEERMKSLKCLACDTVFADCKCDKASLHPKPQPPPKKTKAQKKKEEEEKRCEGCGFRPHLCGCAMGQTIWSSHRISTIPRSKAEREHQMRTTKCGRCGIVFSECQCNKKVKKVKKVESKPPQELEEFHADLVRRINEPRPMKREEKHSTLLDYPYTRADWFLGVATLAGCVASGIFVGVWGVLGVLLLSFMLFAAGGER